MMFIVRQREYKKSSYDDSILLHYLNLSIIITFMIFSLYFVSLLYFYPNNTFPPVITAWIVRPCSNSHHQKWSSSSVVNINRKMMTIPFFNHHVDTTTARKIQKDDNYDHMIEKQQITSDTATTNNTSTSTNTIDDDSMLLLKGSGMMISSYTDGLKNNDIAKEFLRCHLLRILLQETLNQTEYQMKQSLIYSPCNGPNIQYMNIIEQIDNMIEQLDNIVQILNHNHTTSSYNNNTLYIIYETIQQSMIDIKDILPPLRFIYIPTALYAIRYESNNTIGKQKQRFRVDAKQRRDNIVQLLYELLVSFYIPSIHSITFDLDDDSIKQFEILSLSSNTNQIIPPGKKSLLRYNIPINGYNALNEWKSHFMYIQGGNTFWLYYCIMKNNYKNNVIQLLKQGQTFYCGHSAGAVIAGCTIETACWKEWDDPRIIPNENMTTYNDYINVSGLNLIDNNHYFFPHYNKTIHDTLIHTKQNEIIQRHNYQQQQQQKQLEEDNYNKNNSITIASNFTTTKAINNVTTIASSHPWKLICIGENDAYLIDSMSRQCYMVQGNQVIL